jgi:phage shock protein E
MDNILFGAAVVAMATITFTMHAADHTKDAPADVKKALEEAKAVLVDVRETNEWKQGHISNAKHLPLSELSAGMPEEKLKILVPMGKIVYLHCAAGGRCLKAAELLKASGYDVRPLKPGYDDLVKAGLPKAK